MPTNTAFRNFTNQRQGAFFEGAFDLECRRNDLLPVRNGQRVRFLPGGKILAIKSNLDWTVLGKEGLAAFVDNKSFQGKAFTYSQLDAHQLRLACDYQNRGFLAGFVVHFRETDVVVFFNGRQIQAAGPKSRFEAAQGRILGHLRSFDVRRIWQQAS